MPKTARDGPPIPRSLDGSIARLYGVGYEQPQPRVVLVKLAQITVARVPGPVLQVALDRRYDAVDDLRGHACEAGGRAACLGVEDPLGVSPEGTERPVGRVAVNRHLPDVD